MKVLRTPVSLSGWRKIKQSTCGHAKLVQRVERSGLRCAKRTVASCTFCSVAKPAFPACVLYYWDICFTCLGASLNYSELTSVGTSAQRFARRRMLLVQIIMAERLHSWLSIRLLRRNKHKISLKIKALTAANCAVTLSELGRPVSQQTVQRTVLNLGLSAWCSKDPLPAHHGSLGQALRPCRAKPLKSPASR